MLLEALIHHIRHNLSGCVKTACGFAGLLSNDLFFNNDEKDLGLIDLFNQYQFTVEESTFRPQQIKHQSGSWLNRYRF
jgi:hypothetical protein